MPTFVASQSAHSFRILVDARSVFAARLRATYAFLLLTGAQAIEQEVQVAPFEAGPFEDPYFPDSFFQSFEAWLWSSVNLPIVSEIGRMNSPEREPS